MADSLVSVIVPTFNRAHCVTRAVDSALQQTHQNVEVVVIDDGSTDTTADVIAKRYGQDPRVKYFAQVNQGVTVARNTGLARATGDFVALLDSDDWWKPWKLSLQLACMAQYPEVGMVWTDMEAVGPDGNIAYAKYLSRMYGNYSRFTMDQIFSRRQRLSDFIPDLPEAAKAATLYTGDIFSQMFMGSLVHTSTVLLRRERLDKVKKFNEELKRSGEDYDFHLRTCREGPVGMIDLSCIQYQIGMADRLTDRKYAVIAVGNAFKTVTRAYEQDADHLKLPPSMINERFAELHEWMGSVLIQAGDRQTGRAHLAKALRFHFWRKDCLQLFLISLMPAAISDSLRAAYRRLKKWRQTMRPAQSRPT